MESEIKPSKSLTFADITIGEVFVHQETQPTMFSGDVCMKMGPTTLDPGEGMVSNNAVFLCGENAGEQRSFNADYPVKIVNHKLMLYRDKP